MHPNPKQMVAMRALEDHDYLLYGGAMGGGKSYFLRWASAILLIAWWQLYGMRNVVAGLFCEDYPALKDRHLSKIEGEFPKWLGTMHTDHKAFGKSYIINPQYGSGVIAFRNLDDASKYQSAEFASIAVDELTKNTLEKFQFLRTRKRWVGIPNTKFMGGTNPGGIGHAWVKKMWMEREFDPNEEEAHQFIYIPARADDNPYLDKVYLRGLRSLPEKLRKAYVEGDWDIFAGQYFSEWRKEHNVCRPFPIPEWWTRYIGLDYGYAKPASVHWYALDPYGRVYSYRELYGEGMTYKMLAKKVDEMTPIKERELLSGNMIADPAIFQKQGYSAEGKEKEISKSGAMEMMESSHKGWQVWRRGNNDRVNGWGVMRQYMSPFEMEGQITSKLIYFENCKNAIRSIPALVHDETRPEDVDTDSEDHAGDECRYVLMDIYETRSEEPEKPKEIITAQDRFENDMKWEKIKKEELDNARSTEWMNL